MRKTENEITDRSAIEGILRRAKVCRLALTDGRQPYIVPVCFGYEGDAIYLHGATEGRKLEMIQNNNRVCFEVDVDAEIVEAEAACEWGLHYRSVIGFGRAVVVEDLEQKRKALGILMKQYSDRSFSFPQDAVERTAVIKIEIQSMTGKQSAY